MKKVLTVFSLFLITLLSLTSCGKYSGAVEVMSFDGVNFNIPSSDWTIYGDAYIEDNGSSIDAYDYIYEFEDADMSSDEYGEIYLYYIDDYTSTDFDAEWKEAETYDSVASTEEFEVSGIRCILQRDVIEHEIDSYTIYIDLTEELGRMYLFSVYVPFGVTNENAGEEILSCLKDNGIELDQSTSVCDFPDCTNQVRHDYSSCLYHLCTAYDCTEGQINDAPFCPEHLLSGYAEVEDVPDFGEICQCDNNAELASSIKNGYTGSDNIIAVYLYEIGAGYDDCIDVYTELLKCNGYTYADYESNSNGFTSYLYENNTYIVYIMEAEVDDDSVFHEKDIIIAIEKK